MTTPRCSNWPSGLTSASPLGSWCLSITTFGISARTHYLRTLISLDAPDLGRYLEEAADDCEEDVRELAVGCA